MDPLPCTAPTLFATETIGVGVWSLAPRGRFWERTNITGVAGPVVGVPRLPFVFHPRGDDPIVGAPGVSLFSNMPTEFDRRRLHERGEVTDWIAMCPGACADIVSEFRPSAADTPERPFEHVSGPVEDRTSLRLRLLIRHCRSASGPDPVHAAEESLAIMRSLIGSAHAARGERLPRHTTQPRTARDHAERVRMAAAHIHDRFAERLTLDSVAAVAHLSPLYFCRLFKSHTGLTVHEYLTRARLLHAVDRMLDPRPTLLQIAVGCGFSSASHFSGAFRRAFGAPPSRVRRAMNQPTVEEMRRILQA